jgi:F-type H+-transporting ATPase subunit a
MTSFVPETIFKIGAFPVTNTVLDTLIVDAIIIGSVIYLTRKISLKPKAFQNAVEMIIEIFYGLTESVTQNTAMIFPYFMSFFLFILLANYSGLIPGFGTIGFWKHGELVPLLRAATSDLNLTLALALISIVAAHVMSLKTVGLKSYLSRYFSINPINLFVGILELVSVLTSLVSLSFRLFGNIYAGEVVLTVVSSIFAFVVPLPFLALELIVGGVQALVFSMLTMVNMSILTTPHEKSH